MGWSQKFISRALDRSSWSTTQSSSPRSDAVDLATGGTLLRSEAGNAFLSWSRAGYQATEPFGDTTLIEVDNQRAFTVVMNAQFTARGASYLSRNLFREVQTQVQSARGNLAQAFLTAISVLDKAFRRIHPFNGPVLDGVCVAAAYLDMQTNTIYLASNGGNARCAIACRQLDGTLAVVAEIGGADKASSDPAACTVQQIKLDSTVDTILVGSPGLWRELSADAAALRMDCYHNVVPAANGGNAAAHLNNHALHAVTRRVHASADPRMRSLRSVQHLQRLWVGDRSSVKLSHRQPVRRRRGDVHGDISAVVLHLQWEGHEDDNLFKAVACKLSHSQSYPIVSTLSSQRPAAAARWAQLRMHFLQYPTAARRQLQQKWHHTVEAALQQAHSRRKPLAKNSKRDGIAIRPSSQNLDHSAGSFVSVSA